MKKNLQKSLVTFIFAILFLLGWGIKLQAQPANDACASAILLTVYGTTGTAVTGDVAGATLSIAAISCGGSTGTAEDDVWYKFVALSTSQTITVVGSSGFDAVVDLRSGGCMGTNIACADATISGETEVLNATGLTVGATYLVRVYDYGSTVPTSTTFTICITTPPPANDECTNAITLTQTTTCTATNGTTLGATQSLAAITCATYTGTADDDVWYKFVATSATPTITVVGLSTFDPVIDLRSGTCTGTNINCADATTGGGTETISATGLTVGSTYYIRVYSWGSGSSTQGAFTICVFGAAASAPANDLCANATTLIQTATCTPTNGTTVGATQSIAAAPCAGTSDDDVWYKFVATTATPTITVVGSAGFDAVVDLRSGACTGTNITCADATLGGGTETIYASGLTVGTTYYIRVYSWGSGTSTQGTFTICVFGASTGAPANDACANAQLLTVYGSTCGGATLGDVAGATLSMAAITCGGGTGTADDDVWYKFVALSSAQTITVVGSTGFDVVIDLRSGGCMGTNIACADATASGTEVLNATGLTVGATYLVRIYSYGATVPTNTTFTICVTTPPPANDDCANAIALTVNSGTTCTTSATGNVAGATSSGATSTCTGSGNDVWYKFTATGTSHIITVTGTNIDAVVDLRSGSCNGTSMSCADATLTGGTETITATGLTIGTTYYVRVYDWNSTIPANTTFTICVTTPAANCVTPGPPTNIVVTPSQTSASFTWAAPTTPAGTPTIVYYWMVSTSATQNWSNYIVRCGDASGFNANTLGTGTCAAPAPATPPALTPNTQYYLHMYASTSCNWTQSSWATTPFTTLSLAPANDECANAINLTVNGNTCTTATTGDVTNATQSIPAISCVSTGTANDDVWYKFTATATAHDITVVGSGSFDAVVDLRSGTCPGTNISCADAQGLGGTEVINATGLTIGSVYYVRVYDWYSGAPPTTTFTICVTTPSANAAPVAAFTANTTTITVGGSVIFTNQSTGAPFTAYDWQFAEGASGVCNPATSTLVDKTVQYTVAGTYTVKLKVTNAFGNDTEEKIGYITVNPSTANLTATSSANPTTVCAGVQSQLSAVPNGGNGSYSYAWSSNPAGFTSTTQNPTVTPTITTTYTVVVTSAANTASSSVVVTVNPLPATPPAITGSANICKGQQGVSYYIPQISGVTGYTWTLPTGATIGSGANTNSIVVNYSTSATSGTITVAGINACGSGQASPAFSVTVGNPPIASAGNNQTIASGSTATLNGSASGGSGTYSYSWTPANLLVNANVQIPTTIALTSTTTFTLLVTDVNSGCTGTATVQVFTTGGSLSATATAAPSTICQGLQSTLQALPSGGAGNYSYAWSSNPAGYNSSAQNPTVSPTVTTTYSVVVSSGASTANATVVVTVNPLPSVPGSITGTTPVCQGAQQISFSVSSVSNAAGYLWSLPPGAAISAGVNTNSILVDFAASATQGNISVVATNACGSSSPSANYAVTVNSLPGAAGSITGSQIVNVGQSGVGYNVPVIPYATNYIWQLPQGVNIVSGANTSSIVVNFTSGATTGVIIVYGSNACGSGQSSQAFPVTVLTGIEEINPFALALYPNPTDGKLTIEMNNTPSEKLNMKVLNAIGEVVYEKQMTTDLKQSFDFTHFANGLYYINITGSKTNKIEKLIIQK